MKEKILRALILILFINLSLYSCDRSNDLLNTDIEIQDFVWKGLNAYYLFQQDTVSYTHLTLPTICSV